MQRRVEQPHRHRQPVHGLEHARRSRLSLGGPQLLERRGLAVGGVGQDHLADDRQAVLAQEHVLGAAQADALGAEARGPWPRRRRCRRWPARPAEARRGCSPRRTASAQPRMVSSSGGASPAASSTSPSTTWPVVPSSEMTSPSFTVTSPTVNALPDDAHRLGADHGRDAPAAGHDGGVADQAAPGGEDALGRLHAVHVLGRRLVADQDRPARPARPRRPRRRR